MDGGEQEEEVLHPKVVSNCVPVLIPYGNLGASQVFFFSHMYSR